MRLYSYDEFKKDVESLAKEIKDDHDDIGAVVAIARGGLTFAHGLSEAMLLREVYSLNSRHYDVDKKLETIDVYNIPDLLHVDKILLVDDIIDSGETMIEVIKVLNRKYPHLSVISVTLFHKKDALMMSDYSPNVANEWIKFFWDYEL